MTQKTPSDAPPADDTEGLAAFAAFVKAADAARGTPDNGAISNEALAQAITAAIRLYAARVENSGEAPPPVTAEATATDVLTAASEMIRALNINGFDLMMWHDCSRRRA
jgi:hypothetical protein